MACLPARLDLTMLEKLVSEQDAADLEGSRCAVAEQFGFAAWYELRCEVERRAILNACDVVTAQRRIEADPSWATAQISRDGAITAMGRRR